MADMIISPAPYTTHGGVPRRLLAGIFLVVMLTAMGMFLATAKDEPLQTGDQKARAELGKPEAMASLSKGQASSVDEAAERARAEQELLRRNRVSAAASQAALPESRPSALPRPDAERAMPAEADAAAAERERASRSAAAMVFDESGASSQAGGEAGARGVGLFDADSLRHGAQASVRQTGGGAVQAGAASARMPGAGLSDEVRRRVEAAAGGRSADMPNQMAEMINAVKTANTPAAESEPDRFERQRNWAKDMAQPTQLAALRPQAEAGGLMLHQGTVIPCVLTRRIHSEFPGVVTARVSMNVYDSKTSRRLLLPQGALLVGAYSNEVQDGQERLQIAFTRLRMPDGSTYELPGATGSDAAGQAGVPGDVNRHYLRRFGSALLIGLLADRVTKRSALPNGGGSQGGGLSATGQVFADTARSELERHRQVPDTIVVEEGSRLNVEVVRDMDFPSIYKAAE